MSFLYYNSSNPDTQAIFKSIKSDQYLVKDPGTGDYIPFTGGGGGSGDLPYWVEPNAANLGSVESKKTSITSDGVDVIDNLNNTASSLTASELIFGDSSTGNSTLTKGGVDTVSRLNAMETNPQLVYETDSVGTTPVVCNLTTGEYRKSRTLNLSYGNHNNTLSSANMRIRHNTNLDRYIWVGIVPGFVHNDDDYRFLARASSTGVVMRNLTTNKGAVTKHDSFTVGDVSSDAIKSSGNWGRLSEGALSFKNGGVTHTLDKDGVGVTNKLKALTSTTPGADSKMLIYDVGSEAFNYADIPTGGGEVELPYYLKSNSLELDGASTQTTITTGSIGLQNLYEEKGAELSSTSLIFGDITGNSTLTKDGVDTVSRLNAMETSPPITLRTEAAGTVPVIFNPSTGDYHQAKAFELTSDGYTSSYTPGFIRTVLNADPNRSFSVGHGTGLVHNGLGYRLTAIGSSIGVVYRNTETNKGTVTKHDSYTVGDVSGDALLEGGKFGRLSETELSFKDDVVTRVLNKDDIAVTNNLRDIASAATPEAASQRMVLYDTTTKEYSHAVIPTGGGGGTDLSTLSRIPATDVPSKLNNEDYNEVVYNPTSKTFHYKDLVSCNVNGNALIQLNSASAGSMSLGTGIKSGSTTTMKKLDIQNKLIMNLTGYYNTWYTIQATDQVLSIFKASLVPNNPAVAGSVICTRVPAAGGVLDNALAFQVWNPDKVGDENPITFHILFEKICNSMSQLPIVTIQDY